jgi:signal transduction histidine kinase
MKSVFCLLLFFHAIIVLPVLAQKQEIERLTKAAEQATGLDKINALAELIRSYYFMDPRKGIEIGNQALKLADSLGVPSTKSRIYNNIGLNYRALADLKTARIYFDSAWANAILFGDSLQMATFYDRMGLLHESLGTFDSSIFFYNKSLTIYKLLKNFKRQGTALENIGTIHLHRGELKSSLTYLLEAKAIFDSIHLETLLPYVYLKLGSVYGELQDYNIAGSWYRKGIEKSLAINDLQKAGIGLNALGILYKQQGKYDSALMRFGEALEIINGLHNPQLFMAITDNMGNVFSMQKDYRKAIYYHKKALEQALLVNIPLSVASNYVNLGEAYYGLGDYQNARACYEKALPVYLACKASSNLIVTYKALVNASNSLHDYKQAVNYYQSYTELKDSLNATELNRALDSLRVKFHTEQTEQDNLFLKQKQEIQESTISLQRYLMGTSFVVLALLLTLVVSVFRNRRKIQRVNVLLEDGNKKISAKAEELLIANDRLSELSKFKDSMNSFLVHDLKNPLNTIMHLGAGQTSPEQYETVRQAGKQMLNLVLNLLDISKYESSTMKISPVDTPITEIIQKALSDVRYLADQKSLRFQIQSPSDFVVHADPGIIQRVFVNLFSNAVRFSTEGELVMILIEKTDPAHIQVVVKDHGTGIPADFLPFVFDRFSQAAVNQTSRTRTTGVGLTFCKMAVEAHGGKIGVDSIVGSGTSVWFTVPLAQTDHTVPEKPVIMPSALEDRISIHFSSEEIHSIKPYIERLKKLSINQISDVKEVLLEMDMKGSANLSAWRTAMFKTLSECNAYKYQELINLFSDARF